MMMLKGAMLLSGAAAVKISAAAAPHLIKNSQVKIVATASDSPMVWDKADRQIPLKPGIYLNKFHIKNAKFDDFDFFWGLQISF